MTDGITICTQVDLPKQIESKPIYAYTNNMGSSTKPTSIPVLILTLMVPGRDFFDLHLQVQYVVICETCVPINVHLTSTRFVVHNYVPVHDIEHDYGTRYRYKHSNYVVLNMYITQIGYFILITDKDGRDAMGYATRVRKAIHTYNLEFVSQESKLRLRPFRYTSRDLFFLPK